MPTACDDPPAWRDDDRAVPFAAPPPRLPTLRPASLDGTSDSTMTAAPELTLMVVSGTTVPRAPQNLQASGMLSRNDS